MTTSTSRSASAAPTAAACPGRKPGKPNSSRRAPCGSVARATGSGGGGPRPGRASVEAASMGRRTLPPAPEGSRGRGEPLQRSHEDGTDRRRGVTPAPAGTACAGQRGGGRVRELPHMELDDYLAELARRLHDVLGDELLGVYAGGSYALGAY